MPDYKEMYFRLVGRVADAIDLLIAAQLEGEEQYEDDEPTLIVYPKDDNEDDE